MNLPSPGKIVQMARHGLTRGFKSPACQVDHELWQSILSKNGVHLTPQERSAVRDAVILGECPDILASMDLHPIKLPWQDIVIYDGEANDLDRETTDGILYHVLYGAFPPLTAPATYWFDAAHATDEDNTTLHVDMVDWTGFQIVMN